MSDMKCPLCGSKLRVFYGSGQELFSCSNLSCKAGGFYVTDNTWKDLICTHKELEQSETCCSDWEKQALDYKAENIALSGELECTRKALDLAKDTLHWYNDNYDSVVAQETINEITALEQKDVK